MFDDLNNTNDPAKEDNTSQPNLNNNGRAEEASVKPEERTGPAPVANISTPPISAPLDRPNNASASGNKIEDIFAGSENDDGKPTVFQPKAAEGSQGGQEEGEPSKGSGWQKIAIPLVLIVGIGLLGVGGVYGYKAIIKYLAGEEVVEMVEKNKQPDSQSSTVDKQEPDTKKGIDDSPAAIADPIASPSVVVPASKDSDNDGLTDAEEAALGTNTLSVDTDDDGLFDREEVKVYGSNPLVPDTDGDGYNDGDEVMAGYNPVGEGKLYEIRQ